MRLTRRIAIAAAMLGAVLLSAQSIDKQLPSWLLLQKGNNALDAYDYGMATRYYHTLLEKEMYLAEAFLGLSRVFLAEGEVGIAMDYLERALNDPDGFAIAEERVAVLYEKAAIHYLREDRDLYVAVLEELAAANPVYSDARYAHMRTTIQTTIRNRGLDKFFELYRITADSALEAHQKLGVYYLGNDRPDSAALHLIFAVAVPLSHCMETLYQRDPDFSYRSLTELGADIARVPLLTDYLNRIDFFKAGFYFSLLLDEWGRIEDAEDFRGFLNYLNPENIWSVKALRYRR